MSVEGLAIGYEYLKTFPIYSAILVRPFED